MSTIAPYDKGGPAEITVNFVMINGMGVCQPACNKAKLLAELSGKKVFSPLDIERIEALGFDIVLQGTHSAKREWMKGAA